MTAHARAFDPITLEVLRNALEATAQEMGGVLKLTAFSPNIKERMDASCAIFDAKAQLVAQAEHVPVHLGSMLKAVGPTIAMVGQLDPGDVVIVNDPFVGGAHLPDITLIAPAHVGETLSGACATASPSCRREPIWPKTASMTTAAATSRSSSSCAWTCRATSSASILRARRRSGGATSTRWPR